LIHRLIRIITIYIYSTVKIGILLIFFIGKYYYKLAENHQRSKWGFAILGLALYYVGTLALGFIVGLFATLFNWLWFETMDERLLGLMFVPAGLASTYFTYKYLEKKWKNEESLNPEDEHFLDGNI
jgi:hypothetical protein